MSSFNRLYRTILISTALSGMLATTGWAQTTPSSAEPGRASERLRTLQKRPEITKKPMVTVDEKGAEAPVKGGAAFTLNSVVIENANAIPQSDLENEYKEYIGKKVSLNTLNAIADRITTRYRNAGYILSTAVVKPQRIKDGRVVIQIIEGSVDQVIFQGNKVSSSSLLSEYAAKIKNSKPLDAATLERYLLLMEDLPGVSARATLRPSSNVSGASDVIITLIEKPVNFGVTADNRGTRYLGQGQIGATGAVNNLFGNYDKTQLRLFNTTDWEELHYGELLHEEQLDSEGTKLGISAAYTRSDAGHTLKPLEVIGHDLLLSAQVEHPFLRSRESNLYGNVIYDYRNTRVDTLGSRLYQDILNVFRVGGSYDFVDTFSGVNRMDVQLSKGFGWDDDSSTGLRSRASGQTNFVKLNAEASHLQPITGPFGLLFSANGQLSNRSLLASEQFAIGGANYGSGYDPSEITGDSGIAARTELQFTDVGPVTFIPTYQLYSFYDIGEVYTRNPTAGGEEYDSLASAGLGLRFNTNVALSGGLELAFPLTRKVAANGEDGSSPRLFFNINYQY